MALPFELPQLAHYFFRLAVHFILSEAVDLLRSLWRLSEFFAAVTGRCNLSRMAAGHNWQPTFSAPYSPNQPKNRDISPASYDS